MITLPLVRIEEDDSPRIVRRKTQYRVRCPHCGSGIILFQHHIMCQASACAKYLTLSDLKIDAGYRQFRSAWKNLQSECEADRMGTAR